LAAIERHRSKVEEAKPNRPSAPKIISIFTHTHKTLPELEAHISFLPSKSLTVSKGTFLIGLQRRVQILNRKDIYNKLRILTRRERDVVRLASSGKKSTEIGQSLGTSSLTVRSQLQSAYQKLGIKNRYELISAFVGFDELAEHSSAVFGS
jgi:DNA-binding CsgD family transcriptional regulator